MANDNINNNINNNLGISYININVFSYFILTVKFVKIKNVLAELLSINCSLQSLLFTSAATLQ